ARVTAQGRQTTLESPYDTRLIFAGARAGDEVALDVVAEEARRIALHIAPIAAVADVGLVVLGGGIGANGDLLYDGIRRLLAEWLPEPPRVEASSLGDAAVLTGALAVGRRAARMSSGYSAPTTARPSRLRPRSLLARSARSQTG